MYNIESNFWATGPNHLSLDSFGIIVNYVSLLVAQEIVGRFVRVLNFRDIRVTVTRELQTHWIRKWHKPTLQCRWKKSSKDTVNER